jgi:hypothetical protein
MSRTLTSAEELLNWMNSKLQQHEECNGCRFSSILRLTDIAEDGSNWEYPYLHCSGVPTAICQPVADHIVCQAKELFNLA